MQVVQSLGVREILVQDLPSLRLVPRATSLEPKIRRGRLRFVDLGRPTRRASMGLGIDFAKALLELEEEKECGTPTWSEVLEMMILVRGAIHLHARDTVPRERGRPCLVVG